VNVGILGNGGFGTAMSIALARFGHCCVLLGHDPVYTAEIARTRTNPRYLEGVVVPPEVAVGSDPHLLAAAEVVLVAVPAQHVRATMARLCPALPPRVPLVSLAKGLEQGTGLRPSQVIGEAVGEPQRVLVLSGPSHAEEIARFLPTTVVLAGRDETFVRLLQERLATPAFRIYRNRDLLGTELCGALKNVMALAAGIADGLGYGDNAKAAILARGIVEMARYGVAEGADERTFQGLAGVGDLAVTAFSRHGRNRAFGERIGRGATVAEALRATPKVAEGYWTARVVVDRSRVLGVEMPLADAVARVLYGGLPPRDAVRALMERDPKSEA
jgi:glycerol-3-phosphate dehydrogenase (NAD(P)+)